MAKKKVFETMNGLRGVAALAVVAYHCFTLHDSLNLKYGFLAVDFFFVLSGFVIAHSYDEKLKTNLSLREFILARLVRLYPLYFAGTLVSILVVSIALVAKGNFNTNINKINAIPFALAMAPAPPAVNNWTTALLYPLNFPAWSLFFELVVNITYAMSVRLWTEGKLLILLVLTGSMILMNSEAIADSGWKWGGASIALLRVFYSFPAGVLIYKLYRNRLSLPAIPSPVTVVLLIALLMLPYAWGIQFTILIGFPLLVAFAATCEPEGKLLSVFSVLGSASYAIYAMHAPLLRLTDAALTQLHLQGGLFTEVLFISLIAPFCAIADKFYDSPVRKRLAFLLLQPSKNKVALERAALPQAQYCVRPLGDVDPRRREP